MTHTARVPLLSMFTTGRPGRDWSVLVRALGGRDGGVPRPWRVLAVALGLGLVVTASMAGAADWGTIVPATSTLESVRARYGAPTRMANLKVEGYDTVQWTYEEPQAPTGMKRMIVDFGLLSPSGYRREVVRTLRLEPHPGVFDRTSVLNGWGPPTRVGDQGGSPVFFYEIGLLVVFDREGWIAQSLLFAPPQPAVPDKPAPPQPAAPDKPGPAR